MYKNRRTFETIIERRSEPHSEAVPADCENQNFSTDKIS